MTTAIILNVAHNEFPLIIGINRDGYSSSTYKPGILSREPFVFGEAINDYALTAVNKHSLFATVIEYGRDTSIIDTERKLSSIVSDAVQKSSIDSMFGFVKDVPVNDLPPFMLIFGNQRQVFLAQSFLLNSIWISELGQGVHTIDGNMGKSPAFNEEAVYIHKTLGSQRERPWLDCYSDMKKVLNNSTAHIKHKILPTGGTCSSTIMAFSHNELARFKFYDRTVKRTPRKPGDPFVPRYIDHIETWRSPDAVLQVQDPSIIAEENMDDLEDKEEQVLPF